MLGFVAETHLELFMTECRLPKFLTQDIAKQAVQIAVATLSCPYLLNALKRQSFHIVVLVPKLEYNNTLTNSGYDANRVIGSVQPHLLYQETIGDKGIWTGDYAEMALGKAQQLWLDRQDGGSDITPHLLFPGDVVYWGGVKRQGIVVACSGIQAYLDRLFSGITADACIALSYHAWKLHKDGTDGDKDFLD
ncbi:MAG: hypothetical protein V4467_04565 [Patescibacteria group bacterium]